MVLEPVVGEVVRTFPSLRGQIVAARVTGPLRARLRGIVRPIREVTTKHVDQQLVRWCPLPLAFPRARRKVVVIGALETAESATVALELGLPLPGVKRNELVVSGQLIRSFASEILRGD